MFQHNNRKTGIAAHRFTYILLLGTGLLFALTACSAGQVTPGTPTLPPTQISQPTPTALPAMETSSPPTEEPTAMATATLATALPEMTPPSQIATPAETAVVSPALTYLAMIDENNGWGLSDSGVFKTSTGGSQWQNVTPQYMGQPGFGARGFFLDANSAWVLVPEPQSFTQGTLYRTNNGGQSWEPALAPFADGQLQFLDAQNGWSLDSLDCGAGSCGAKIHHSTDGGQTWAQVYSIDTAGSNDPNGLPFSGNKTGIAFLDNTHGWVTGTEPRDGYVWLFRTQDGGKTWKHQDLPLTPVYAKSTISVDPPHFFNTTQGVLPASLFSDTLTKIFYVTQDGGNTWEATVPVKNSGVYSIASPQDFFVWDGATFDASHDGGKTWTSITPNINLSQVIVQLDMVNATTGWVTSMDANGQGQIYKTTNGGQTWLTP